jgi:hypothetical protein
MTKRSLRGVMMVSDEEVLCIELTPSPEQEAVIHTYGEKYKKSFGTTPQGIHYIVFGKSKLPIRISPQD